MNIIPKKRRKLIARLSNMTDCAGDADKSVLTGAILVLQELRDKHYLRARRRGKKRQDVQIEGSPVNNTMAELATSYDG